MCVSACFWLCVQIKVLISPYETCALRTHEERAGDGGELLRKLNERARIARNNVTRGITTLLSGPKSLPNEGRNPPHRVAAVVHPCSH